MEQVDVVYLSSQLKRLTKEELINIIVTKDVSSVTNLSSQVIEQLNVVLNHISTGDSETSLMSNGDSGALHFQDKLRFMEREADLLKDMNRQLKDRVAEQSLFINVLTKKSPDCSLPQVNKSKLSGGLQRTSSVRSYHGDNPRQVSVSESVSGKPGKPQKCPERTPTSVTNTLDSVSTDGGSASGRRNNRAVVFGRAPVPAVAMTSVDNSFAAVVKRAYIYIGNVNPNVNKENIVSYLKDKCASSENDFDIEDLPVRNGARSKSFKLTTDFKLLDSLNNPELWPEGVVVKRFFRRRQRQADTE